MRNDNMEAIHKPNDFSQSLKGLPKFSQPLKNSFFQRMNGLNEQKKDPVTFKKSIVAQDTKTISDERKNRKQTNNESRESIHRARLGFINDYPELNQENVLKLSRLLSLEVNNKCGGLRSSNADSRLTGGGKKPEMKNSTKTEFIGKTQEKLEKMQTVLLTKKPSFETNIIPVVSFKTKNTSRKPVYCAKVSTNTTKVAFLAQKFNDIIKENNNEDMKLVKNDINKEVVNFNINNSSDDSSNTKENETSVSVIKTNSKVLSKIQGTPKALPNIIAVEKINTIGSPSMHRKVFRIKSEPKKKNSIKKKSNEPNSKVNSTLKDEGKHDAVEGKTQNLKSSVKRRPSFKTSPTRNIGMVRATIQKFELEKQGQDPFESKVELKIEKKDDLPKSSENKSPTLMTNKPGVPEKKVSVVKTKNLVVRDGKPLMKIIRTNQDHRKLESKASDSKIKIKNYSQVSVKENVKRDYHCEESKKISNTFKSDRSYFEDVAKRVKITKSYLESLEKLKEPTQTKDVLKDRVPKTYKENSKIENFINEVKKENVLEDLKSPMPVNTKETPNETIKVAKDKLRSTKVKKEFNYNKTSFPKLLHKENLRIFDSFTSFSTESTKDPKDTVIDQNNTVTDQNNTESLSNVDLIKDTPKQEIEESNVVFKKAEKDTYYEELTAKLKPNESFLWRANSKNELTATALKDIEGSIKSSDNDIKVPEDPSNTLSSTENICVPFSEEALPISDNEEGKYVDADVQSTKDFIAEAINMFAINDTSNIRKEIALMYQDEDYEPLYIQDDANIAKISAEVKENPKTYSKANCPLPELPKQIENECKFASSSSDIEEDTLSLHNYEYCPNKLNMDANNEESDDGYEYCKYLKTIKKEENTNEIPSCKDNFDKRQYMISKSDSLTSSIEYEKISSIYEKMPSENSQLKYTDSILSKITNKTINYDDLENIYDTIKHSDTTSISNCYESIPASPQANLKRKQRELTNELLRRLKTKNISFDTVSTFSQSTISSDQKTNSIYGQRSIISYDKQNSVIYGKSPSELSFSDRSDDWEDMSDQEKNEDDTTFIVVRDRSKGKHSPTNWSRKVRHQWAESAKKSSNSDLFITSSSIIYIITSKTAPFHSDNDETHTYQNIEKPKEKDIPKPTDLSGLAALKVLVFDDDTFETQEITVLIDSSDGEHFYESLSYSSPQSKKIESKHIEENFDSFSSDVESENSFTQYKTNQEDNLDNDVIHSQLPDPPPLSNTYALTRFANAAGKKMKQLKNNLTKSAKRKKDENTKPYMEVKSLFTLTKKRNSQVENSVQNEKTVHQSMPNVCEKNEVKDARNGIDIYSHNESHIENVENNTANRTIKTDMDTISRKSYLSFKSKFRRSVSIANSQKSLSPITPVSNSTFYLDNMDDFNNQNNIISKSRDSYNESLDNIKENEKNIQEETDKKISIANTKTSHRFSAIRPNDPPPPPPLPAEEIEKLKKEKRAINTMTWYADFGLYKSSDCHRPEFNGNLKQRPSSTSWYAEIGLYQPSDVSTSSEASSNLSGSGTCSTTTALSSSSTPTPPLGMFNQEPLYQFYDADKLESVCRDLDNDYDLDNYEEISHANDDNYITSFKRPSAMSLVAPRKGPSRTLWCEIPEVVDSLIYSSLTQREKKLQEAKFEIVTSEASYLNSLKVVESQYINNITLQDERIITKKDRQILFGNILPVKKCSERLMSDLETCWQDSILLNRICKIIKYHAEKYFNVYITYCENQIHIIKTLKKLKTDPKFNEIISQLQCQPACQSLSLDSFLMLPMQRITRLPLLMDAILKHLDDGNEDYQLCLEALAILNNVVLRCNEGTRNIERIDEMFILSSRIEFPSHIKEIPIVLLKDQNKNKVPQRWLIRSGELIQLTWRSDESILTFGKKITKIPLHVFLFNDLLIVTKRKGELYTVVDYCNRSLVEITLSDMMTQSPVKETGGKFVILLTMLENYENKTVEILLSCASETDRQRWLEAFSPPPSCNDDEKIYEEWDCPQVTAIYSHHSTQPDELTLQPGDIINVDKKMADGWYHGERIRDGEAGWFPGNYTVEIASSHVRARNLRQRYRLLELAGKYLVKEKRKSTAY